jgi:hypothetical protein
MVLVAIACGTNGCDQSNSRRMTPPEEYSQVDLKTEISVLKNSNAVDVLFVVDNSESMKTHQQKLAANIQYFVKAFNTSKNLDYHIGVTPIFDSKRYGSEIKNFNPNGFLLPLKGDTGSLPKFFYTRQHNNLDLLAKSIYIGVLPLRDQQGNLQGPEFEEVLSPVYAAFTEPAMSSPSNQGFFRPDARLSVIMITDADDSSPGLSGGDLDYFLKNLKNDPSGSKISVFGVLADKDECAKVDYGMVDKPHRLIEFLDASRGKLLSLCKGNFATMLTEIGQEIEQKVQKQKFPLQGIPEHGTLKVSVGGVELAPGPRTWTYNPTTNEVAITALPKSQRQEDLSISIKYRRVNMQNQKNGRAKRLGA